MMARIFLGLLLVLLVVPARTAYAADAPVAVVNGTERTSDRDDARRLTHLPIDKGLPVIVHAGVYFQSISTFDENAGTFDGTVDMRLRWEDPRLRYAPEETPRGFKEWRRQAAEDKLKELWTPGVDFPNLASPPTFRDVSIRVFPNGWVELMQRTSARFAIKLDAGDFPFDRQTLEVEAEMRGESTNEASLVVLQEDVDFSRAAPDIALDGWDVGLVQIRRPQRPGWYGEYHSAVVVGLQVKRQAAQVAAPVFIPLIASLLIPLVAIWMNAFRDGAFVIEAFELANVIVGGLFAVIALNFTVNSAYKLIAAGDNTVSRLFGLNYVTLAVALAVVVLMYRYNVLKRWFGRHVEGEVYAVLVWALPVLSFATAATFIAVAALG